MRLLTIIILFFVLGMSPVYSEKINAFEVKNNEDFVLKIFACVKNLYTTQTEKYSIDKQIPFDLIVAMAAYESGWGTSRFAVQGNNLFGIRTWDDNIPQMKPLKKPNSKWGVRKYVSYCTCIEDYIQILNNHPAYEEFRQARANEITLHGYTNATTLSQFLVAWSELGTQYTYRLREIILLIHSEGYYKGLPVNVRGQIIE